MTARTFDSRWGGSKWNGWPLPQPGDHGVMIALGPGFAAERGVLQW